MRDVFYEANKIVYDFLIIFLQNNEHTTLRKVWDATTFHKNVVPTIYELT